MPYSAEIFGTLVESKELQQMHDISNIKLHNFNPYRDESAKFCQGGWSLIPIQWNEIENRGGKILSDAHQILNFEFFHTFNETENPNKNNNDTSGSNDNGDKDDNENENDSECEDENENGPYVFGEGCFESDITVSTSGNVHAIMLYWKVYLLSPEIDPERTVTYTTQPNIMNWQDHWLQVVFLLPEELVCVVGDIIRVTAAHDTLRIWLQAVKIIRTTQDAEDFNQNDMNDHSNLNEKLSSLSALKVLDVESETNKSKKMKITEEVEEKGNEEEKSEKEKVEKDEELKIMVPIPASLRLLPSQCSCGWHLLCGAERIQAINDEKKNNLWARAIDDLLVRIADPRSVLTRISDPESVSSNTIATKKLNIKNSNTKNIEDTDIKNIENLKYDNQSTRIILDVGDGSVISIAIAREINRLNILKNENYEEDNANNEENREVNKDKSKEENKHENKGENESENEIENVESNNESDKIYSNALSEIKVVSMECKTFSRMFHDRLVDSNDVQEIMMIWDGIQWDEINEYYSDNYSDNYSDENEGNNEEEIEENVGVEIGEGEELMAVDDGGFEMENKEGNEEMEEEDDIAPTLITLIDTNMNTDTDVDVNTDATQSALSQTEGHSQSKSEGQTQLQTHSPVTIAALVSECFYYQLHALPTWQAISFLYKRTELQNKLEKNALILPGRAYVMAAAIELTDLSGTYGKAGM